MSMVKKRIWIYFPNQEREFYTTIKEDLQGLSQTDTVVDDILVKTWPVSGFVEVCICQGSLERFISGVTFKYETIVTKPFISTPDEQQ